MKDTTSPPGQSGGMDRRTLLRRTAVAGGAVVWTTPLVQTVASPAFAAGSPLCDLEVEVDDCTITYLPSVECCDCVEEHPELSQAEALALCAQLGRCTEDLVVCGEEEEKPPPENPPPDNPPPRNPPPGNPPPRDLAPSDLEVGGRQAVSGLPGASGVPTVIPAGS